jgi:hypothetical protein
MSSPREPAPSDREPRDTRVEELLRPFFSDSALWPVLVVLFAALTTFGAALLLLALKARSAYAIAALVVILGVSLDALRGPLRRRRFGIAGGSIVAFWLLSALLAGLAAHQGLF